jgi:outer membrane protein TolC
VRIVGSGILGLLFVVLATGPLGAQGRADTVSLTLSEAVSRALATSEEVETARTQRLLADAQITQTRAGALPQISGGLVSSVRFT